MSGNNGRAWSRQANGTRRSGRPTGVPHVAERRMTADQTYARRAAARLNTLLDEEGFPYDMLGRATAVGEKLGIGLQVAEQLLSGLVTWTWSQLQKVCAAFDRPPGYFLDPVVGQPLPSDVRLVTGVDGGESLVWRTPRGFLQDPPAEGAALRYFTMRQPGTGFALGSLLVYAEQATNPHPLHPGRSYVVDRGDGAELMRFQHGHKTVARFEPLHEPGVTVLVPLDPSGRQTQDAASARVTGAVFAAISPA